MIKIQDFIESDLTAKEFLRTLDLDEVQVSGDFNIPPTVHMNQKGTVKIIKQSQTSEEDDWLYKPMKKPKKQEESTLSQEPSILGDLDIPLNVAPVMGNDSYAEDDPSLPNDLRGLF